MESIVLALWGLAVAVVGGFGAVAWVVRRGLRRFELRDSHSRAALKALRHGLSRLHDQVGTMQAHARAARSHDRSIQRALVNTADLRPRLDLIRSDVNEKLQATRVEVDALAASVREHGPLLEQCVHALADLRRELGIVVSAVDSIGQRVVDASSRLDRMEAAVHHVAPLQGSVERIAATMASHHGEALQSIGAVGAQGDEMLGLLHAECKRLGERFGDVSSRLDRLEAAVHVVEPLRGSVERIAATIASHHGEALQSIGAVGAQGDELLGLLHAECMQLDDVRQVMRAHVAHIDESFNTASRLLEELARLEGVLAQAVPTLPADRRTKKATSLSE